MPELRPGSERCECCECGMFFSGTTGFDDHRTGSYSKDTRRCRTAEEIKARGYIEVGGVWKRDVPRPEFFNVSLLEAEQE